MMIRRGLLFAGALLFMAAPVAAQNPNDDNYTSLAGAHLQDAQTNSDEAEAMAAYQRALDVLRDGMADRPNNPKIFFYAGIAQLGLKNYAAADSAFDRAEEMYPEYKTEANGTEIYRENGWIDAYNAGLEALNAGQTQDAITAFGNANLVYDRRPEAFLNLANSLAQTGDNDGAIEAYQAAVMAIEGAEAEGHHPDDLPTWLGFKHTARINTALLMMQSDQSDAAIDLFFAVLDDSPGNADACKNLRIVVASTGSDREVPESCPDPLDNENASPVDLYNAGVGFYQADDFLQAAEAFRMAVDKSPMFRDALQNLTQALVQAAQDDPENMDLWGQLAEYSEQLIAMDPYNEFAYRFRGIALARSGDSETAIALSEQMEALPFTVQQLTLRPGQGVVGGLVNKTLEPGSEVRLRFTFYDVDGNEIGTAEASVSAPAQGEADVIQAAFDGEGVAGYSYELIG